MADTVVDQPARIAQGAARLFFRIRRELRMGDRCIAVMDPYTGEPSVRPEKMADTFLCDPHLSTLYIMACDRSTTLRDVERCLAEWYED